MRQVGGANLSALLFFSGAFAQAQVPSDFEFKTLDPGSAVRKAEFILLASPTARRQVRTSTVILPGRAKGCELIQTETALRVDAVLKGGPIGSQGVTFTHYDVSGYEIVMGPPGGPSGPIGSKGIFFLRRNPDGTIRSVVDAYRPDIPTPWIQETPEMGLCSPSACIAGLLLTFHEGDDAQAFVGRLLENVAVSRPLVGFFETFALLDHLVDSPQSPYLVRYGTCTEQAKWYALELPPTCRALAVGNSLEQEYVAVAAKLRKSLQTGGLAWARRRIGSEDPEAVKRYIQILEQSPDRETREVASSLRSEIR